MVGNGDGIVVGGMIIFCIGQKNYFRKNSDGLWWVENNFVNVSKLKFNLACNL